VKKLLGIAAAAALALPAVAHAKGPDRATITGPGLHKAIVLSGFGESGKGTIGRLTMEGGFFPEVFGQQPDPRLEKKPGDLGPRVRVDYRVPGPEAAVTLHQDLYPYAAGGLVTFMASGQRLWAGQRAKGGWMRAPELAPGQPTLREALIANGLPRTRPTEASSLGWSPVGWVTAEALALVAAALFALRRHRRVH
jgi:hypothetical protein